MHNTYLSDRNDDDKEYQQVEKQKEMPLNQQCKIHSDWILRNENELIITFEGSFEYSIHNAKKKRRIEVIKNRKTHD